MHKSKFASYGCNAPGVVMANYLHCSKKVNGSPLELCIGRKIPIANVDLFGVLGQAYFDSGAKTTDFKGCEHNSLWCNVILWDRTSCEREYLTTKCNIIILFSDVVKKTVQFSKFHPSLY